MRTYKRVNKTLEKKLKKVFSYLHPSFKSFYMGVHVRYSILNTMIVGLQNLITVLRKFNETCNLFELSYSKKERRLSSQPCSCYLNEILDKKLHDIIHIGKRKSTFIENILFPSVF